MNDGQGQWKLAVHGSVVQLDCEVPFLLEPIAALADPFKVDGFPSDFLPADGSILPYDSDQVLSSLPETARHLTRTEDGIDVYEDCDRYWVVDERWGMAEIDVHRNEWRSWIIPQPRLDAPRLVELAVLWPLAQLLRPRGLHLVPAVSAVRDGFAMLILCPFGLEPELSALIHNGYKIIGQRWTALREEDGRIALLHVPGRTPRMTTPRLRMGADERDNYVDLTAQHPGSAQHHAFCDAVLVAEPGRRPKAHLRATDPVSAIDLLRRQWPIPELESSRRGGNLVAQLAEHCRCFEVQLSRNTKDLLALLSSVRYAESDEYGRSAAA